MSIRQSLLNINAKLPSKVCLVAVSKTKPIDAILEAYNCGHRDFGENKVQELTQKVGELPEDIKWHAIGHLQRNKVKYIAPFVHLIHSADSLRLIKEINKQANKNGRVINVLIQVHIAKEETKYGFSFEELDDLIESNQLAEFNSIAFNGLMGMATLTDDEEQIRGEFKSLHSKYNDIKNKPNLPANINFEILSMGMSGDYQIAIEEGSNLVRIGSAIFGERN